MKERKDYEGYYYRPISAAWMRRERQEMEQTNAQLGDNPTYGGFPVDYEDTERGLEQFNSTSEFSLPTSSN